MGYADNPFAPITEKERIVMNHLKTLLNRISPENQQSIFSDLTDQDIPELSEWTSERETSDPVPDTVHLIGLSKHPPVDDNIELSTKSGDGPIDLYSKSKGVGVAIEGKTKESLREGQLSRYATELNSDSCTIISWSDLYRVFSRYKSEMHRYPSGLVDEFLAYLEQIQLHKPHQAAKYVWGDGDGVKQIRVEQDSKEVIVIWKVEASTGSGKRDTRRFSWSEFCTLFESIQNRHGEGFIRRIFVDAEPPFQQPELDTDTVLGEIDPIRDNIGDENYLRLNYHQDGRALKLRTVRPSKGGTVGMPYSPSTDGYVWYTHKYELLELLEPQLDLPGFNPEFREALFVDRDLNEVKSHLW